MATIGIQPVRPYKTISGNAPFVLAIQEAATQTFTVGALVIQGAAGKMAEGGANPARILGVAEEPGHNVAAPGVQDVTHLAMANSDTLFVGNVITTTALSDIGNRYGVTKVGSNWQIDKSKTGATARIIIVDLDPRDAIGDTQGRLLFMFMADFTAFASTS